MRNVSGLFCVCGCVLLLAASAAAQDPTISLKAVRLNPVCTDTPGQPTCSTNADCLVGRCSGVIAATSVLDVSPGDVIVAEVRGENWSPNGEKSRTYQATVNRYTFFTDESPGAVLPLGWDRPMNPTSCNVDSECPPEWPHCAGAICGGPDNDPALGAYIGEDRGDWIYAGLDGLIVAVNYVEYTFGTTLLNDFGMPIYEPPPKYLGTLILKVEDDACETFNIELDPLLSRFMDENNVPVGPLALLNLTLNVDVECLGCSVASTDPDDCAQNAGQPSEPDGSDPAGWDSIDFTFNDPCDGVPVSDFEVGVVPDDGPVVTATSVDWDAGTFTATVNFDGPIPMQHWTCVTYTGSDPAVEKCIGWLPADVDASGCATTDDIARMVNHLEGAVYPEYQCDVDQSGLCASADILRVIDLLNGADQYDAWLDQCIDACPPPP